MRRRRTYALAFIAFVILAGVAYLRSPDYPRNHPNIVLIIVDTLRPDHLPAYGYPRTTAPFLTRLSKNSAVFDAWSPTSWTKPAVATILTGLHPVRHQTFGRTDVLSPDVLTLADVLGRNGYDTLGITSNVWASRDFGFDRGFRSFQSLQGPVEGEGPPGPIVNQALFPRLSKLRPPYFLLVHYVDPHMPYRPATQWNASPIEKTDVNGLTIEALRAGEFGGRPRYLVDKAIDLYDGEIRQVDGAIAALIHQLELDKLDGNTIVVFTADHGEEFEEHGRMGHGQSLFEEAVRVPLMIHGPNIPAGKRRGRASLMDVFPTIVDLAQIDEPNVKLDGISLRKVLSDASGHLNDRDFLFHLDFQDSPAQGVRVNSAGVALLHGDRKLVLSRIHGGAVASQMLPAMFGSAVRGTNAVVKQVFDIVVDPQETDNLFGRDPSEARILSDDLANDYNALSRARARRTTITLRDETRRAVMALGYLVGHGTDEQRSIPPGIRRADSDPAGDLGWGAGRPCIDMSDIRDESQLLSGWFTAEPNGRWMTGKAVALLPLSKATARNVSIAGINGRPDVTELTVIIADRSPAKVRIPPGPFALNVDLPQVTHSDVVRFSASSVYRPSENGGTDARELGLFLTKVCVQ